MNSGIGLYVQEIEKLQKQITNLRTENSLLKHELQIAQNRLRQDAQEIPLLSKGKTENENLNNNSVNKNTNPKSFSDFEKMSVCLLSIDKNATILGVHQNKYVLELLEVNKLIVNNDLTNSQVKAALKKNQCFIAVLSRDFQINGRFIEIMESAVKKRKEIILVFDKGVPLPHSSDIPISLRHLFENIAIEINSHYLTRSWDRILDNIFPTYHQDICTDVFLSYKQLSATGIVTTVYERLTGKELKVFLDIRTKFKLHKLDLLVANTTLFVFVLSEGVLNSDYCYLEFDTAWKNKKKIAIITADNYEIPHEHELPERWRRFKDKICNPDMHIHWSKDYFDGCMEQIFESYEKAKKKKSRIESSAMRPSYGDLKQWIDTKNLHS